MHLLYHKIRKKLLLFAKDKNSEKRGERPFRLLSSLRLRHLPCQMVGVEQMMRFLSEGLAEIVAIERLHIGIFCEKRSASPLSSRQGQRRRVALRQLLPVMNGLTAAARAAPGTGHDLDKVIADLATLRWR